MKLNKKRMVRALSAGLAAMLMLACVPGSALAAGFSAKVKAKTMYVAKDPKGEQVIGKLSKGTVVTVKAYVSGVAKIKYKGRTGYAKVQDMVKVKSEPKKAEDKTAQTTARKAIAKVNTVIFEKPDTDSDYAKVKAGTGMYVLAIKGSIAQVKKGGKVGYAYRKHLIVEGQTSSDGEMTRKELEELKKKLEAQQKKKKNKTPSIKDAFTSGKYSNEQLCFLYLTKVVGYNTAAAAGVLANINYESGFKTSCVGDGGTSIGICQWHLGRKTRLQNYCKENGVSSDTLVGQLAYLKYELEHYYPKVHNYLKGVSNTAQGAYDAAYYFCYNFEAPAARTSQSVKRGSSAKNTYFPRYAKV